MARRIAPAPRPRPSGGSRGPLALLAAAALSLGVARPAWANGRFPATGAIYVAPKDPSLLAVRATFGVLISRDAGKAWDWVCEESVGFSGAEDPPLVWTERPVLLAALFSGLSVSGDRGCSFAPTKGPSGARVMNDLTVARARPREVLALGSGYSARGPDGGNTYDTTLFASADEGDSFEARAERIDPTVLFETVEVAESDPSRVYLSGARDGTSLGVILTSTDRGRTFVEHTFPLIGAERAPYIGAVDPERPDRLYVRTGGGPDLTESRLLVSDDAGVTFREAWRSQGPMTGLALSPDGARVYAGSAKDGLVVADRETLRFEPRARVAVGCLTVTQERVLACSTEQSGFVVGESRDDGRSFTALLHLSGLRGPLACGAGSTTKDRCEKRWPRLRDELGIVQDAGIADAASPGPAPAPAAPSDPGGCVASPRAGIAGPLSIAALLAAAVLARARARRR